MAVARIAVLLLAAQGALCRHLELQEMDADAPDVHQHHHHHHHRTLRRLRHKRGHDNSFELGSKHMLPLCAHRVETNEWTDSEMLRWPRTLQETVCEQLGCSCAHGDYRCVQLYSWVSVAFVSARAELPPVEQLQRLRSGCVCAARIAAPFAAPDLRLTA